MTERDFIAAALACFGVQVAAPHFCAQEAGVLGRVYPCHAQYVGVENFERDVQSFCVFLEVPAALRRITRVHCKEHEVKIHCML